MQGTEILDKVETLILSYGGLLILVPFLVGGIKGFFKTAIEGKEPLLVLALTYVIGILAKVAGLYGDSNLRSWLVHGVSLLVVAILANLAHDKVWNAMARKGEPPK